MIPCSQCASANTLDSSFCRRCGSSLPADEIATRRSALEGLVADGGRAFEEGRLDDAGVIAEEAVLSDPASPNAHALRGMVFERRGEVARALEAYERVVELNPDSALDRIKLANLRQALADRATAAGPDRRVPALAGVSAAVLIVCAGVVFAKLSGNASVTAAKSETMKSVPESPAANVASDSPPLSRPGALGPGDVPAVTNGTDLATTVGSSDRGDGLPAARRSSSLGEVEVRPQPIGGDLPSGPIGGGPIGGGPIGGGSLPQPSGGSAFPTRPPSASPPVSFPAGSSGGDDPAPRPQGPVGAAPNAEPGGKRSSGFIEISVGRGKGGGAPSAAERSGGADETLRRVGDASLQTGDLARAATSYERVRRDGEDPVVNQRLGQTYERMGRKSEAAAAYARAQAGYESRLKANPGDERAKNGLASVQQAQRALGGS